MSLSSWISPKTVKGQPSKIHGKGFFATQDIKQGELVAIKAGHLIDKETLDSNQDIIQHSQVQVTDDIYIAPMTPEELPESMIYYNHSCEPNLVMEGQIVLTAYRDITAGEELTIDYGTAFNDGSVFECYCQTATCRKTVTGKDWQKKELQQKYGNNFAWFISRKLVN